MSARIYGAEVFSAPPPEISGLFSEIQNPSFFTLPEWFSAIGRCGADAGTYVGLLVNSVGNVGLAFRQDASPVLRSCTNLYTCDFDLLGSRSPVDMRAFAREIAHLPNLPPYINLEGISRVSPSFSALMDGFRQAGLIVKPYRGWANWYERVQNLAFDQYLERRPSILRSTWRRKLKSLEKIAEFGIDVLQREGDVEKYIAAYETVERASWKGKEPYPGFISTLIRLAAHKGALRMGVLYLEKMPAAAQFWIVWKGRAVIFKLAHAQRFSRHSPGTVLTMHMLRLLLKQDAVSEIGFGRGNDPYKNLWASSRRDYWGIEAANPRKRGGLLPSLRIGAALVRSLSKDAIIRNAHRPTAGDILQ